ncbi:MAG: hypothetical protein JETT_2468 [Candidatus Jettenia ecosi]|uniref:Uncharacterized protein n=1 Tax=Candidatus Jettenia ecosi TaxID=2494326 RepID=A0A533Q997_9BACT|nr:MAG: hypothetical protein JETT_2468 [Candidatus Jettenia ecosi]
MRDAGVVFWGEILFPRKWKLKWYKKENTGKMLLWVEPYPLKYIYW